MTPPAPTPEQPKHRADGPARVSLRRGVGGAHKVGVPIWCPATTLLSITLTGDEFRVRCDQPVDHDGRHSGIAEAWPAAARVAGDERRAR